MFKNKTVEEKKAFKNKMITAGIMVGMGVTCLVVGASISREKLINNMTVESNIKQGLAININSPITNNVANHITNVMVNRSKTGYLTRCLNTGELFESQSDAAKAYGLSPGEVSKQIRGLKNYVDGYQFENIKSEQ